MFGDGKIDVISHNGELYINMWEVFQHLVTSSYVMENEEGENVIADTLRLVASTLCDLAIWELGKDSINSIHDLEPLLDMWKEAL